MTKMTCPHFYDGMNKCDRRIIGDFSGAQIKILAVLKYKTLFLLYDTNNRLLSVT